MKAIRGVFVFYLVRSCEIRDEPHTYRMCESMTRLEDFEEIVERGVGVAHKIQSSPSKIGRAVIFQRTIIK